jgi:fructosamine-3-kinase
MDFAPPGLTWGQFYAEHRLMPYAERAFGAGSLDRRGLSLVEAVADKLLDGALSAPQPGLLPPAGAARLHGDLWAGNVLWSPTGQSGWTGATLIDPAAHGGHAETDLAMLDLFGLSHLARVIAAYNEVSPLADGWRDRIRLHQLHPLLVHAVLFGGAYGARASAAAERYASAAR